LTCQGSLPTKIVKGLITGVVTFTGGDPGTVPKKRPGGRFRVTPRRAGRRPGPKASRKNNLSGAVKTLSLKERRSKECRIVDLEADRK